MNSLKGIAQKGLASFVKPYQSIQRSRAMSSKLLEGRVVHFALEHSLTVPAYCSTQQWPCHLPPLFAAAATTTTTTTNTNTTATTIVSSVAPRAGLFFVCKPGQWLVLGPRENNGHQLSTLQMLWS